MIKEILTAAGLTFRRGRFVKQPAGSYAVYMDDVTTDGPDGAAPQIFAHDVTVELYEPAPDDETEEKLEAAMSAKRLHWTKQDRFWIQSEQLYQVIYEFSYIEKRRN